MMKYFIPGQDCEVILSPLGPAATSMMLKMFRILHSEGVDVALDHRRSPVNEKLEEYSESDAQYFCMASDDRAANNVASLSTTGGFHICGDRPVRVVIETLLEHLGREPLPHDVVCPGEDESSATVISAFRGEPQETRPEPPPQSANGLPISKWLDNDEAEEEEAEEEAEVEKPNIQVWELDDPSWRGALSAGTTKSIETMTTMWKISPKARIPVVMDDRVFLKSVDACRYNGVNQPGFSKAMKAGRTEYCELSIGFAVPALDAIRRGLTREEFAAEVRERDGDPVPPPAVDPVEKPSIEETATKALEEAAKSECSKLAPAPKPAPKPAASPEGAEVVAMLVVGEDGELAFDRDFDVATAQKVIAFCKAKSEKAARIVI